MYSDEILERFKNPKFSGKIKDADAVGEEGNFKCGDIMKIYLKVKGDKIKDVKFETYGCVAAIASTDIMCELVKGKTLKEAYKMSNREIVDGLGDVPSVKVHCSILGTRALRKAIEDYRQKK
ncbi:MAG: iron-sulfur cluster assembly scaffold protein [Nanoarchaeota archaeon]|nr:iron-sulfur cluster assembly scaffold protein [Nanoarchaeota archaeon]MBU1052148.1 iron-sulfur cluster assembly scaffold protein [Nanoarchaeota archaeon]MBU1988583.1 iron-sulfur cluster assembly scaffold protein [Nanoarchaeota archaeon]